MRAVCWAPVGAVVFVGFEIFQVEKIVRGRICLAGVVRARGGGPICAHRTETFRS
jgi:hypothetical protein